MGYPLELRVVQARIDASPAWRKGLLFIVRIWVAGWVAFVAQKSVSAKEDTAIAPRQNEPIKPIPIQVNLDARKVALGAKLFREPKLSHDDSVSCSTCHDLKRGGVDQSVHSKGIHGSEGVINAPTIFNCGFNFKQFWDGRANSLEEQANGPVENALEMGSSWNEVVSKLRLEPGYTAAFSRIYKDEINAANIRDAIAEFERSLVTPNCRFDKFLRGDNGVLTRDELEGYRKFKAFGCSSCHQGVNIGGNMFETLGVMADYFKDRGKLTTADLGRFNITGKEQDRYLFKVPSLRNVAVTAPYFHNGAAKTLEEAVRVMGQYQLGEELSDEDIGQITRFLGTLTGEYEGKPL